VITDEQITEWTRRSVEQIINCKTEDLTPQDVLRIAESKARGEE
jgi:hypothetical protein